MESLIRVMRTPAKECQKLEEAKNGFSQEPPERVWPCPIILILDFCPPELLKLLFLSNQVSGNLLQQPQEPNTNFNWTFHCFALTVTSETNFGSKHF